ncbi:MAG: hypothetical protein H8D78_12310 [Chloroflexi bacterium]|nr:hypothetical protein [Chloroflexota bacterium]
MLAVRGIYKDGQINLLEPVSLTGPRLVTITFLDEAPIQSPVNHEGLEALEGIVGLLRDLTPKEEERFDEAIERRSPFIGPREVAW